MAQIGQLTGGAGVVTTISGQSQAEELILIGDVDTANPLQGLSVEIDGTTFINIQSAALITAYMKWMMEIAGAVVGLLIKVATGKIIGKNTTYRFTNAGATTPNVYGYSVEGNGVPIVASTMSINANSYADYEKFSALFLETPANVDNCEIIFKDGTKSTMTTVEVASYFALRNQSEANGLLGSVVVIDNTDQSIQTVRVNTNAVGACTVLRAKLPDEAYKILTSNAA